MAQFEGGSKTQREADAYLAACSALLLAIATDQPLTDAEAQALLDAMPDQALRDNLSVGLIERGLREGELNDADCARWGLR